MSPQNPWLMQRGRWKLSTNLRCRISFPQQDNASFDYLFLVTICFYSEQPLTSYYVSIFYNKNSNVRKDNNTPSMTPSQAVFCVAMGRIKMTGTPVPNRGLQDPGNYLKEASSVAFRKLPLWNPPPSKVARRIKGWLINKWPGIFSHWSDLHSKYIDFCNPGISRVHAS